MKNIIYRIKGSAQDWSENAIALHVVFSNSILATAYGLLNIAKSDLGAQR